MLLGCLYRILALGVLVGSAREGILVLVTGLDALVILGVGNRLLKLLFRIEALVEMFLPGFRYMLLIHKLFSFRRLSWNLPRLSSVSTMRCSFWIRVLCVVRLNALLAFCVVRYN